MTRSNNNNNNKSNNNKSNKKSEQLCLTVLDKCSTISTSNAQNHFGKSWFQLQINVDPLCNNLEKQLINIQLLFEDGEQTTNIKFITNPNKLILINGECKFKIKIDTYSMYHDNRAFKFYFNLTENATRHIRPCETKPFRLVLSIHIKK